jgi:hypothetical protein
VPPPPAPPPAPAPIDELEAARASREYIDPAEEIRQRQALVDRQRGERSDLVARHGREVAELIARQAGEEKQLEHRHAIEWGRLREELRPGSTGPWLEHQAKRGRRA